MTTIENTRQLPQRWQRSRKKGAKQPPNTRYCGRPTMFENRHIIAKTNYGYEIHLSDGGLFELTTWKGKEKAHERAVEIYKRDMVDLLEVDPEYFDELLGYDYLSCFCPLDMPCHVDVIIEHLAKRSESRKMKTLSRAEYRGVEILETVSGVTFTLNGHRYELATPSEAVAKIDELMRYK